ncbi:MAG TPA: alpha/beta hydrolase [Mogibacterium sp.]|nr:alpha/beta hydrolase [Mogibacterium sp.]
MSNKFIVSALRFFFSFLLPKLDSAEEIYAHAKANNEKQVFKIPKNRKIEYSDLKINTGTDLYHCLRMKRKDSTPEKAILYICGGGGVYDYCNAQLIFAKKLLSKVDAEIYYPFYPPSTVHPIREAHSMIFETYRAILNKYSHENIGVLGLSFGGTAAMTMLSWNNYYNEHLPMPALTIAFSPGHMPANTLEREMLETYRDKDPIISVEMVEAYTKINRGEQELEHWLIHTAHGDFRNAGKIFLYYGEDETLAFAAPIYRDYLERAGAEYNIHLEPGMPHCYGVIKINNASGRTYDEVVTLLNNL